MATLNSQSVGGVTSSGGGTSGSGTSGGTGSSTGSGDTSGGSGTGSATSGSGTTGAGTGGSGTTTGSGGTGDGSGTTGSGSTGSGTGTTTGSGTGSGSPSTPPSGVQIVITSPGDGATVGSPVHVTASTTGSSVAAIHVYVDNGDAFQTQSAQLDASLNIPGGTHSLLVQAWDQSGNVFKSAPVNVTVNAPPPAPSGPSPSVSQIQRMSGWDNCSGCAGKNGDGPSTSHDMATGINSPSISGSSAKFWLGGTPWGAALWWRELGGQDDMHNFQYDLDFYTNDLGAAQALEFDMNQNVAGNRYIYGTECDFRNTGTWRVWNGPAAEWVSTGVGCSAPSPGTWHHLTWEFARSGGQVHFVAVTLDGDRHEVDRTFDAIGAGGSGLDVAFQADLNGSGGDVTVWLDNVNVAWW